MMVASEAINCGEMLRLSITGSELSESMTESELSECERVRK